MTHPLQPAGILVTLIENAAEPAPPSESTSAATCHCREKTPPAPRRLRARGLGAGLRVPVAKAPSGFYGVRVSVRRPRAALKKGIAAVNHCGHARVGAI